MMQQFRHFPLGRILVKLKVKNYVVDVVWIFKLGFAINFRSLLAYWIQHGHWVRGRNIVHPEKLRLRLRIPPQIEKKITVDTLTNGILGKCKYLHSIYRFFILFRFTMGSSFQ